MHPFNLKVDPSVEERYETKLLPFYLNRFDKFIVRNILTIDPTLSKVTFIIFPNFYLSSNYFTLFQFIMAHLLHVETTTGCACRSPRAGVLNITVCIDPREVPIQSVGTGLVS